MNRSIAEAVRFAVVGVANTLIGYGTILMLQEVVGTSPWIANGGGYLVGWVTSYLLNRRFTFRSRVAHRKALPGFLMTAAVAFAVNLAMLALLMRVNGLPLAAAQALAMVSYTVTFFVLAKYLVFRPASPQR